MHYIFVVQKEGINGIIKIKWSLQERIENEAKNSKNTLVLSGLWSDGTGGIKGAKMGITQMAQVHINLLQFSKIDYESLKGILYIIF